MNLTESPDFFKQVARYTPGMVVVYNIRTGQYIYVNDAVRKILGYEPEVFMKKGIAFVTSLVHPDDLPGITAKNMEALKRENREGNKRGMDEVIVQFEYRMRHKNGTYRWLQTDGSVFRRDERGKIECVLNISIDITERKSIEDKRTYELSHIVESITEGFLTYDNDMRYTYINKAASKMLGKTLDDLRGKTPMEIYPHYADTEIFLKTKEAFRTKKPLQYEYYSPLFKIWFECRFYPRSDGLSVFFSDVTERKELEAKKDEFIGIASHELKTPLTSIKGYTQILERMFVRTKNKTAHQYIAKQKIYIERLSNLITDLLDVSKIQAGRLAFNFSRFEFDRLIADGVEAARAHDGHHAIRVRGKANRKIRGDSERLEQVLVNLLTNAMKYSPNADQVDVFVKNDTRKKEVTVSVVDYGVGILKKDKEHVFERFYRSSSAAKRFSGLGIGLYISSEIIKRHRGRIEVESRRGRGSTFSFSLPY